MMRRIALAAAALALALCAVGIAVEPLKAPVFTRVLVERYAESGQAGITDAEMARAAEQVRRYVVSPGRSDGLPETVAGRAGFDRGAVSHLDDVARVLSGARILTLVLAALLLVSAAVALRAGAWHDVARALRAGAGVCAVVPALAGLVALSDFDAFFAAFHGVFFAEGTWTFPYDSLLILLFPEPFWVTSGVAWAVLTVAFAALMFALSVVVERIGTARAALREG